MKMKTLILFALIFSIATAYGQNLDDDGQNAGCAVNGIYFDFTSIFKVDCKLERNTDLDDRCKCLEKIAKDNFIVGEGLNGNHEQDLINQRNKAKATLTNQFMDVYSQMTVESAAQSQILNIDERKDDELVVGCPAPEISKGVKDQSAAHYADQEKKLQKLLDYTKKEKSKCHLTGLLRKTRDCNQLDKEIARIEAQQKSLNPPTQSCDDVIAIFKTDQYKNMLKDVKDASTGVTKTGLTLIEKFLNDGNITGDKINKIMDAVRPMFPEMKDARGAEACTMFLSSVNKAVSKREAKGGEVIPSGCNGDVFCESLETTNSKLKEKFKDKFKHNPAEECISFAEFKTYKSMPSEALMEAFAKKGKGSLLELDEDEADDDPLYTDKVNFLRSNPILGKMASNRSTRKELAERLHDFAKQMPKTASEHERLKAYLAFMKGPVKKILNHPDMKKNEQNVCTTMIDNFTAIRVAQDIPEMNKIKTDDDNIAKLFKSIEACRAHKYNKSTTTNLLLTLKTSPIFTLGVPNALEEEGKLDTEFADYKKRNCGDYKEKIASCKSKDGIEGCRQEYLGNTGFSLVNTALRLGGVATSMSEKMWEKVSDFTNIAKQDYGFKEYWHKTVGAHRGPVLAGRGQENQYIHQQNQHQNQVAKTEVPKEFHHNTTSSVPAPGQAPVPSVASRKPASSSETSKVNEGQERPAFLNPTAPEASALPGPVTFNPDKVGASKSVEEINPQFAQMNPENKVKYLDELQNYVSSRPDKEKLEKELKLSEELEEATDELNELKKENQEDENKVASKPVTGNSAPVSQPVPANAAGMYPMLPSGGSASAQRVKLDPAKKKSSAVNDALNAIHDQKSADGRDVSSVSGDLQVVIQNTEADVNSIPGPFKVVDEISAGSHENYLAISQDANKLAEFIASRLDTKKIKDSEIISIQDPGTGNNMLFKVNKKSAKSFSLESWPLHAKVERRFKLDNLNNTIKQ